MRWLLMLLVIALGVAFQPTATVLGQTPAPSLIAFVSERDGNQEIYVMNADGSNQRNLSNHPADDWHPVWSPDGTMIAFTSLRDNGDEEIYIMNADGSGLRNISNRLGPDNSPTWSPDGTRVAFASERGVWDIYAVNIVDATVQQITTDGQVKSDPTWSPDGARIAYWGLVGQQTEVYVVNSDGSNTQQLTFTDANDGWPRWTSDGYIMFDSRRDGNWEIYVMDTTGLNPANLTRHPATDGRPSWSDWEWRIVFGSERDGNSEIYSMLVDGTSLRRLTNNTAPDHSPDWQPNPAFTGDILGMTQFVEFGYTTDSLVLTNLDDSRWMFLVDVAVVDSVGNRIALSDLGLLTGNTAASRERLAPNECIYLHTATTSATAPDCTVVAEVVLSSEQAFWLQGFNVDSVLDDVAHTCAAPRPDRATRCLMPR